MNPPRVYTSFQSWIPLPPPIPYHHSGSPPCTSPKHPVSCIEHRLAFFFFQFNLVWSSLFLDWFLSQQWNCLNLVHLYSFYFLLTVIWISIDISFLILLTFYCLLFELQFSHSVVSNSLRPHGLQHARPPCRSPTPRVYSNSCPLSRWCHPTISSSVLKALPMT